MERLNDEVLHNAIKTYEIMSVIDEPGCSTVLEKCILEFLLELKGYREAEEQGLLVRLPCKVGDTVYEIASYCWDCFKQTNYCHLGCKEPKYRVRNWKVNSFSVGINTIRICGHAGESGIIGETVFLTKEEAEKALERMNENA